MFNVSLVYNGLGTFSVVVPEAGSYAVNGQLSLPSLSKGDAAPSEVVAVVKVNSSTKLTGEAGATGIQCIVEASAGDSISITLSSSAAVDQPLNAVKLSMALSDGAF